jgi:hypothetical protein
MRAFGHFKWCVAVAVVVLTMGSGFSEEQPCCASAWKNKNSVGLRLSYTSNSFGGDRYQSSEINWQIPVLASNRLELGVNFAAYDYEESKPPVAGSYDATFVEYGVVCSYLWVKNVCRGFSWSIGPSVGAGKWRWPLWTGWDYDENTEELVVPPSKEMHEHWYLGLGPQFGIEYRFNSSIVISMDFRPMWEITGGDLFGFGWGYSVRYAF